MRFIGDGIGMKLERYLKVAIDLERLERFGIVGGSVYLE